jgi:lipopolysaccharide biosynthesis glycosyltransferase
VPRHGGMHGEDRITVALAADEDYALPLAVALRSLLDHAQTPLDVFVLESGLSGRTKRLLASWSSATATVAIVHVDASPLEPLPGHRGGAPGAYLRLLIPATLADRARAIYLDADTLVLSDLRGLWLTDLEGRPLAAAQEMYAPYVSSPGGLLNWREIGLAPDLKYFNSGVLVLDLLRWRSEGIAQEVIEYLRSHSDVVRWWDQDGLNAVLAGRWAELDPAWNVTRYWDKPERRRGRHSDLLQRVRILHFLSEDKPWLPGFANAERLRLFRSYLARTGWTDVTGGGDGPGSGRS